MKNAFGRIRTFPQTQDTKVLAGMQREGINWRIQSTVGDAMSVALYNLFVYRDSIPISDLFRICLSIHDAILLLVPGQHVARVIEDVFPTCMCDGLEVPGIGLHYTLGTPDVSIRWGEHADPDELRSRGVAKEYCGYENKH